MTQPPSGREPDDLDLTPWPRWAEGPIEQYLAACPDFAEAIS